MSQAITIKCLAQISFVMMGDRKDDHYERFAARLGFLMQ